MLIEQAGKMKEVTLPDIYPNDFTEILYSMDYYLKWYETYKNEEDINNNNNNK
jgi:hypothetical protein